MSIRKRDQFAGVFIVLDLATHKLQAQYFGIPFHRRLQVADGEGNVPESAYHSRTSRTFFSMRSRASLGVCFPVIASCTPAHRISSMSGYSANFGGIMA